MRERAAVHMQGIVFTLGRLKMVPKPLKLGSLPIPEHFDELSSLARIKHQQPLPDGY